VVVVDVTNVDERDVIVRRVDVCNNLSQQLQRASRPLELCDVAQTLVQDTEQLRVERIHLSDQLAVGRRMFGAACQLLSLPECLVQAPVDITSSSGSVLID